MKLYTYCGIYGELTLFVFMEGFKKKILLAQKGQFGQIHNLWGHAKTSSIHLSFAVG